MNLGCCYIKVSNLEKSVDFYSKLLQIQPRYFTKDRWVMFDLGRIAIALYNLQYDLENLSRNENLDSHYNKAYIEYLKQESTVSGKNVVFNFYVDNLNNEYERLKSLNIGPVSDIMYVNISMPYYFFIVNDPDGNEIEITGKYEPLK